MKKKEKRMILILLVVLVIAIVAFIISKNANKGNKGTENKTEENTAVEEFVQVLEDGTKLNGFLHKSKETTQDVILSIHGMSSNCFKERDNVIANTANNLNIDYFCFNNRGSELVKYITKNINGKKTKVIAGTSYEEVLDSYYDIVGAILELRKLGYKNIYLQGHSLGCTKIIYTYNKLKEQNNTEILEIIKNFFDKIA